MKRLIILSFYTLLITTFITTTVQGQSPIIWKIGENDNNSKGFALAPSGYKDFLRNDFGWEDHFFLVGHSDPEKDFPYVLPGPEDAWGGTGPTSGIRSHLITILFGMDANLVLSEHKLVIDIMDNDSINPPLLKININGKSWKYPLVRGSGQKMPEGNGGKEQKIEIPIAPEILKAGGNVIEITSQAGAWVIFDQIRLEGPKKIDHTQPGALFLRAINPAEYEIEYEGKNFQPLLIDVQHLKSNPRLSVLIDGKEILSQDIEEGRYMLEAPMPAVTTSRSSAYEILVDGKVLQKGEVNRKPQKKQSEADYVDTGIGTAHSRWMIAPGPWMPFSMVKLSPDNQNSGWQAGYDPSFESIGTFSHIHEWTMAGLGTMPTNGPLKINVGDENAPDQGYRSSIDKSTEKTPLGYYSVLLSDYGIKAELTATTRCGFQKYTFPKEKTGSRIVVDLQIPSEYTYQLEELEIRKVSSNRIEGFSKQRSPDTWFGISQDYILYFVLEFDQPIKKFGTWLNKEVSESDTLIGKNVDDAGAFVEFDTKTNQVVKMRSGISLVSTENAGLNLKTEISDPFGWNFEAVIAHQKAEWNKLLGRAKITSNDRREKVRFYTNMYRALCSRNTWSDVDGSWVDANEEIRKFDDPETLALGCDAFWNTFWNLNQFWNLLTPEWSSKWVKSQLAMYDAHGWLAKGPAGMEYIPVMVAEHEIPLIVGAYQMGIRDFDVEKAFEATLKMQTTPGQSVGQGYAGNRDLEAYLKYKYVPYDLGRFSNTLEYAYDDWTVSQFALATGKTKLFEEFADRATWWKNVIDPQTGFARLKKSDGSWVTDFDPFQSGRNEEYVEGNAWQLTYFVPQDVPGLAKAIGKERFIERLEWGFEESEIFRFNAPNDQYWDYPVIQGNQQSMHFAFLFNWVDRPWLTQKWSRSIMQRYYGYGTANAYLGDEDQGQMSAWLIMASIGLFQTDGGCSVEPIYEIGSPIFEKVVLNLGGRYNRGEKFTIEASNVSRKNVYVQSASLNGAELNTFWFPAAELLKGGSLVLEMGPEPNKQWGVGILPQSND